MSVPVSVLDQTGCYGSPSTYQGLKRRLTASVG